MKNNPHYDLLFQSIDKSAAFDQLAELYYDRNFSSASKSEIDLIMFSIYMDALIHTYQDAQGILDYQKTSDYEIARQLGISQEKVRGLKIRKQARYPVSYNWMDSLLSIRHNIRFDGKKIIIPVSDPNLCLEIRNFITSNGGYIEFESGKDYLRIRTEYFLMLMYETLEPENKKQFLKAVKRELNEKNKDEGCFEIQNKVELANSVLSLVHSGTDLVDQVVQIFNPTNQLAGLLHHLISTFTGKA